MFGGWTHVNIGANTDPKTSVQLIGKLCGRVMSCVGNQLKFGATYTTYMRSAVEQKSMQEKCNSKGNLWRVSLGLPTNRQRKSLTKQRNSVAGELLEEKQESKQDKEKQESKNTKHTTKKHRFQP